MNISKETTELLNSLTYHNYGHIVNSKCSHLSPTNRLAIVTQKCFLIVNPNLEWPAKLKASCAQKYISNSIVQDPSSNSENSAAAAASVQRAQIDTWIQDLRDAKRASFFINLVSYSHYSSIIAQIYTRSASLDSNNPTKRVPFYKKMLEKVFFFNFQDKIIHFYK